MADVTLTGLRERIDVRWIAVSMLRTSSWRLAAGKTIHQNTLITNDLMMPFS